MANPSRDGDAKLWALNCPEGGTVQGCQATEGMDGTRKYAWWSGPPQGGPDFFARTSTLYIPNSSESLPTRSRQTSWWQAGRGPPRGGLPPRNRTCASRRI